ncbi:hypothetical protein DFS34DRAFT_322220 [Phlyctochytrium arcticum]|nr:hypothetical protein DFS34DRAFT_322220 [Phlyctochytrium arcticum]
MTRNQNPDGERRSEVTRQQPYMDEYPQQSPGGNYDGFAGYPPHPDARMQQAQEGRQPLAYGPEGENPAQYRDQTGRFTTGHEESNYPDGQPLQYGPEGQYMGPPQSGPYEQRARPDGRPLGNSRPGPSHPENGHQQDWSGREGPPMQPMSGLPVGGPPNKTMKRQGTDIDDAEDEVEQVVPIYGLAQPQEPPETPQAQAREEPVREIPQEVQPAPEPIASPPPVPIPIEETPAPVVEKKAVEKPVEKTPPKAKPAPAKRPVPKDLSKSPPPQRREISPSAVPTKSPPPVRQRTPKQPVKPRPNSSGRSRMVFKKGMSKLPVLQARRARRSQNPVNLMVAFRVMTSKHEEVEKALRRPHSSSRKVPLDNDGIASSADFSNEEKVELLSGKLHEEDAELRRLRLERMELHRQVGSLKKRVIREVERAKPLPKITSTVPTSVEANLNLRYQFKKTLDAEREKYQRLQEENRRLAARLKEFESKPNRRETSSAANFQRTNELLFMRKKLKDSEAEKRKLEETVATAYKQLEKESKAKEKTDRDAAAMRQQFTHLRNRFGGLGGDDDEGSPTRGRGSIRRRTSKTARTSYASLERDHTSSDGHDSAHEELHSATSRDQAPPVQQRKMGHTRGSLDNVEVVNPNTTSQEHPQPPPSKKPTLRAEPRPENHIDEAPKIKKPREEVLDKRSLQSDMDLDAERTIPRSDYTKRTTQAKRPPPPPEPSMGHSTSFDLAPSKSEIIDTNKTTKLPSVFRKPRGSAINDTRPKAVLDNLDRDLREAGTLIDSLDQDLRTANAQSRNASRTRQQRAEKEMARQPRHHPEGVPESEESIDEPERHSVAMPAAPTERVNKTPPSGRVVPILPKKGVDISHDETDARIRSAKIRMEYDIWVKKKKEQEAAAANV